MIDIYTYFRHHNSDFFESDFLFFLLLKHDL